MKTLVLAIIVHCNKVLIVRRSKKDREVPDLFWSFPGGKVEAGESVEQALYREVLEEVGLSVKINNLLHSRTIPKTTIRAYYYHCSLPLNNPLSVKINQRELSDFAWVTGQNALAHFTSDVAKPVVNLLLSLDLAA